MMVRLSGILAPVYNEILEDVKKGCIVWGDETGWRKRGILHCIIKDGKKLQEQRSKIGEMVFQRRLKLLKRRLNKLLRWKNPNPVLKEVIKKVKRTHTYTPLHHSLPCR